eukprot:GFYU01008997.1.p1 GENE.GFYU01008997.1~~GFYU01008997.1.p1  ORF type:complete len:144 (-),score=1.75 GFYU01008997.1:300-731(-)
MRTPSSSDSSISKLKQRRAYSQARSLIRPSTTSSRQHKRGVSKKTSLQIALTSNKMPIDLLPLLTNMRKGPHACAPNETQPTKVHGQGDDWMSYQELEEALGMYHSELVEPDVASTPTSMSVDGRHPLLPPSVLSLSDVVSER